MKRLIAVIIAVGILGVALPVLGDHLNDGGVDEAWNNSMNQESYWEGRFGADCTKFENHSGYIPAQYDAAVVKDGNMVRVYDPAPTPFWALGAVNPANDNHFNPPHSWVMKCKKNQVTTTTSSTTIPEETTTTEPESSTTTAPSTTSTSTTSSSTSSTSSPTSSTIVSTTSSVPPTQPPPTQPPPELPFTGFDRGFWVTVASMFGLAGIATVGLVRRLRGETG